MLARLTCYTAIRLILDPKLSDFSRLLRAEDFWEGLDNPVKNGETIEVAIEFAGLQREFK